VFGSIFAHPRQTKEAVHGNSDSIDC
jgi:hypothetical protein